MNIRSQIMKAAWNAYKAHYAVRPWIKPVFARDFGDFLSIEWNRVTRKHVVMMDMRPMHERGHMYQAVA